MSSEQHDNEAPVVVIEDEGESIDNDPEEYVVEAIRSKRKNPKTGSIEYLIKWENYPESDNTWEPEEHLKCPEIVDKFNEQERNKRRRKKAERLSLTWSEHNSSSQTSKRAKYDTTTGADGATTSDGRQAGPCTNGLFLEQEEYDDNDDNSSTIIDGPAKSNDAAADQIRLRGFERGLPIDRILTASIGDDEKLYFFLKWQGRSEFEMVEADDVEQKAPQDLCRWYRERLYWCISDLSGLQTQQQPSGAANFNCNNS